MMIKNRFIASTIICLTYAVIFAEFEKPDVYYLFSHGIVDNYEQAYRYAKVFRKNGKIYQNERYLIEKNIISFNYPDIANNLFGINWHEASLGQDNEIACLHQAYQETEAYLNKGAIKSYNIVLVGLSRGATAILNYMAQHDCPTVKAVVLESPYDEAGSMIKHILSRLGLIHIPGLYALGQKIMEVVFGKYRADGIQAINMLEYIRKDLPIMLICSQEDQFIPSWSVINIYKKLKISGHDNVHLLIVKKGKHSKVLFSQDGQIYLNVVHAFYQKYNLPHNSAFAEAGQKTFRQTMPEITENKEYFPVFSS